MVFIPFFSHLWNILRGKGESESGKSEYEAQLQDYIQRLYSYSQKEPHELSLPEVFDAIRYKELYEKNPERYKGLLNRAMANIVNKEELGLPEDLYKAGCESLKIAFGNTGYPVRFKEGAESRTVVLPKLIADLYGVKSGDTVKINEYVGRAEVSEEAEMIELPEVYKKAMGIFEDGNEYMLKLHIARAGRGNSREIVKIPAASSQPKENKPPVIINIKELQEEEGLPFNGIPYYKNGNLKYHNCESSLRKDISYIMVDGNGVKVKQKEQEDWRDFEELRKQQRKEKSKRKQRREKARKKKKKR